MRAEFDITLSARDMYRFSMYHAYTGSQGIVSIVISAFCFFAAFRTYGYVGQPYTILYAAFGVLFLIYIPFNLYLRSKRQILLSEALRNMLHYVVDEQGIHTSQNGASADLPWEQVYKLIVTGSQILIYSNRVNAYIIPRNQIAAEYEAFCRMAKQNLPKYRLKMK